jgi:hypothetical protein
MSKQSNERLIATALHCNPLIFEYKPHQTGATIVFKYKYVSEPLVLTQGAVSSGFAKVSLVSKNKDSSGYYISASVVTENCSYYDWIVVGVGVLK